MKLVPNAGAIALKSLSLWANRLGFVSLIFPWLMFTLTGAGPNPVVFGWIGVALYVLAELLRYLDQGGLDGRRDTFFSPAWVGLMALMAILMTMGMGETVKAKAETVPHRGLPTDVQVMDHAVPLVANWEGLRLKAYLDVAGVPTICYGETMGVNLGETRTRAECEEGLRRLLPQYLHGWYGFLTPETKAQRLTATRAAAFNSFAYNVGIAGAGRSTATKRLNAGDIRGGCDAMLWWNKATVPGQGKRVIRGLVNRRNDEWRLCVQGL